MSKLMRKSFWKELSNCAIASTMLAAATLSSANGACPPAAWSRAELLELKRAQWQLDDPRRRETLAIALVDCLADADPALRDEIAFEGLAAWMREAKLGEASLRSIHATLIARLAPGNADAAGFAQPFAALALSEVARADRLHPFLKAEERNAFVDAAVSYLASVRDYRGFDPKEGWRHGVAHGADLLMQLALNPAIGRAEHQKMLSAIAAQIAPAGEHFYVYGEGQRLARPVLIIARRGTLEAAAWAAWLKQVSGPGSFNEWEAALQTRAGLARRHNVAAFVLVLYTSVREGVDEAAKQALLPALVDALRSIP